jgi:hypothetical protein
LWNIGRNLEIEIYQVGYTKAGSFKTKRNCEIEFTLPAFHENRNITCNAYVDESHHESSNYDIIIGRDLLHSLGIKLLFDTAEIVWDNAKVSMQTPNRTSGNWVDTLEKELLFAHDPTTTDAERIQNIIESKYCPADLQKIVEEWKHLSTSEHLENRSCRPRELKDPNVKPYHAKPYPVPYSKEKRLRTNPRTKAEPQQILAQRLPSTKDLTRPTSEVGQDLEDLVAINDEHWLIVDCCVFVWSGFGFGFLAHPEVWEVHKIRAWW